MERLSVSVGNLPCTTAPREAGSRIGISPGANGLAIRSSGALSVAKPVQALQAVNDPAAARMLTLIGASTVRVTMADLTEAQMTGQWHREIGTFLAPESLPAAKAALSSKCSEAKGGEDVRGHDDPPQVQQRRPGQGGSAVEGYRVEAVSVPGSGGCGGPGGMGGARGMAPVMGRSEAASGSGLQDPSGIDFSNGASE